MLSFFSFLAGLIFGLGLIISGMANPAKVMGFLNITQPWDPSLALVMLGALTLGSVGFALAKKRALTLCATPIFMPTTSAVDLKLLGGAALFGLGWGVAGICPGPALLLLGAGSVKGAVFVLAMLAGMWLVDHQRVQKKL